MTKIQIIKKQDGYAYKYIMNDKNGKQFYVTKSGFKTPEMALEIAKKSYAHRLKTSEKAKPIKTKEQQTTKFNIVKTPKKKDTKSKEEKTIKFNTISMPKKKDTKIKKSKPTKFNIKNLKLNMNKIKASDGGYRLVETLTFGAIVTVIICGGIKVYNDMKDILPEISDPKIEEEQEIRNKESLTIDNCDFSNLHIILRTAEKETSGVGAITSDMLTKIGVENEIINKDSDIFFEVYKNIDDNSNKNIIVINIESGLENDTNATTVMGDCSNKRQYPSDILAACINESLNEYNFDSVVKSGQKADIWRKPTDIEEQLATSGLINSISQLTINLPKEVGKDELTRNDAASSIVEGLMRWSTLDLNERYQDIYYTTQYSDTLVTLMQDHGVTLHYIEKNSDIDMSKGSKPGNTVLLEPLPKVVTDTIVHNPCTTTDPTKIKLVTTIYTVQYGDTVTKIANMYGMKIEDMTVPSGNINDIKPGDIIYINTYNLYETHSKTDEIEKEKQNIK